MSINHNILGKIIDKVALNKWQNKVNKINDQCNKTFGISCADILLVGIGRYRCIHCCGKYGKPLQYNHSSINIQYIKYKKCVDCKSGFGVEKFDTEYKVSKNY